MKMKYLRLQYIRIQHFSIKKVYATMYCEIIEVPFSHYCRKNCANILCNLLCLHAQKLLCSNHSLIGYLYYSINVAPHRIPHFVSFPTVFV